MGFLRRYVFRDIGLKLFSLIMAVCLWAAVSQGNMEEVEWSAAIKYRGIAPNLEINSASVPVVKVWLNGPSRVLDHVGSNDVYAAIDLSHAQPGEHTYLLSSSNLHVPDRVRIKQIDPAQVHVYLDVRKTRTVEVHPRVVGRLASGFAITNVVADPPQIKVAGPAARVDRVEAAITDPIDATGLLRQHTFTANAYVSDPLVQVVNPEPVRVTIFVGKSSGGRD